MNYKSASLPPMPSDIAGKYQSPQSIPSGYVPASNLPKEAVDKAWQILGANNYGHGESAEFNNINYFYRVEPHYNEIKKWHKGVTVYAPKSSKPSTNSKLEKDTDIVDVSQESGQPVSSSFDFSSIEKQLENWFNSFRKLV